jgi:MYXO-CTERM domain-containing protein
MSQTTFEISMWALAALLLVLYLMRRNARRKRDLL